MKILSLLMLSTLSVNAANNTEYATDADETSSKTQSITKIENELVKPFNNYNRFLNYDNVYDDSAFMLGIGALSSESLYKGGKTSNQLIPYISYQHKSFFINGASIGFDFDISDNFSFITMISSDLTGDIDRGDSQQLKDMHKLKDVGNAVVGLNYAYNHGNIRLNVTKDISNQHKGLGATLLFSSKIALGQWSLIPEIGSSWFSSDISQYYYGVQEDEALPNRAFYQPKSGFNYNLGLTLVRPITEHHNIAVSVSHDIFSSEITNSPIVEQNNRNTLGLFYFYTF